MEIVKRGEWTEPADWEAEVDCMRCQSRLRIGLGDLIYVPAFSDQREPHTGRPAHCDIECAVCGGRRAVETPEHVQQAAKNLASARAATTTVWPR